MSSTALFVGLRSGGPSELQPGPKGPGLQQPQGESPEGRQKEGWIRNRVSRYASHPWINPFHVRSRILGIFDGESAWFNGPYAEGIAAISRWLSPDPIGAIPPVSNRAPAFDPGGIAARLTALAPFQGATPCSCS